MAASGPSSAKCQALLLVMAATEATGMDPVVVSIVIATALATPLVATTLVAATLVATFVTALAR